MRALILSQITLSAYKNFAGTMVYGINDTQNAALAARSSDLIAYINSNGGSLISLGQSSLTTAYNWLPSTFTQVAMSFTDVTGTTELPYISSTTTCSSMSHASWHGYVWLAGWFRGCECAWMPVVLRPYLFLIMTGAL